MIPRWDAYMRQILESQRNMDSVLGKAYQEVIVYGSSMVRLRVVDGDVVLSLVSEEDGVQDER